MQKLESTKENITFSRVDADNIDKLISKDDTKISKLTDEQKTTLETVLKEVIPSEKFMVQLEPMDSDATPFMITQPEFMRRMKEMQATGGGGMFGKGNFPEMYNLVVNTNSPLVTEILETKTKKLSINKTVTDKKDNLFLTDGEYFDEIYPKFPLWKYHISFQFQV